MCTTYTLSEIGAIYKELQKTLEKIYGDSFEVLNKYFEMSAQKDFDIIVYIQFMDPEGMIQSIGRHVKK